MEVGGKRMLFVKYIAALHTLTKKRFVSSCYHSVVASEQKSYFRMHFSKGA